jgi:hypothetical protein
MLLLLLLLLMMGKRAMHNVHRAKRKTAVQFNV